MKLSSIPLVGLVLVAGLSSTALANTPLVAGGVIEHSVQPGDFLLRIGARFGVAASLIARENGLDMNGVLRVGKRLIIDNRHIVPQGVADGIVINLPQRMLYFIQNSVVEAHYPVGLGRRSWPTPVGSARISKLLHNPEWNVPKSIQEEMQREGQVVIAKLPPGPDNPLGNYWVGLGIPGYGIHGTIASASIYQFRSHGCIRLHPDDIESLFPKFHAGMPVNLIYEPIQLAVLEDGEIFLEVNPDIYRKAGDPLDTAHALAKKRGVSDDINWDRVEELIARHEGGARQVNLSGTRPKIEE